MGVACEAPELGLVGPGTVDLLSGRVGVGEVFGVGEELVELGEIGIPGVPEGFEDGVAVADTG